MNRLDHPSIIKYFDAYETEEHINAVLEYSPGISLDHLASENSPVMSFDKLAAVYLVAKALAYLKNEDVVHRDIKPANVILAKNEGLSLGVSIQLIDFGFAKDDPRDKELVGSPQYMAPEAILKNAGPASDVWSLGILFYNIISGTFPFLGDDAADLFDAISLDYLEFSPMSKWDDVPLEVIDLISRCLEKNPKRRITIEEVLTHSCFYQIHSIIKSIDITDEELQNIKAFSRLSNVAKKFLDYAIRFLEPYSVMGLKERFILLDSHNLGYIPILPNLNKKIFSTTTMSSRVRSLSDCNTVDTMKFLSEKHVGKPTKITATSYVAANISSEIFKEDALISLIFNSLKGKDDSTISIEHLQGTNLFKDNEDDIVEELALLTSKQGGVTKLWLHDYLITAANKLAGFR